MASSARLPDLQTLLVQDGNPNVTAQALLRSDEVCVLPRVATFMGTVNCTILCGLQLLKKLQIFTLFYTVEHAT